MMKKKRVEDMTLEELDEAYRREVMSRQIKQARENDLKSKVITVVVLLVIAFTVIGELVT